MFGCASAAVGGGTAASARAPGGRGRRNCGARRDDHDLRLLGMRALGFLTVTMVRMVVAVAVPLLLENQSF